MKNNNKRKLLALGSLMFLALSPLCLAQAAREAVQIGKMIEHALPASEDLARNASRAGYGYSRTEDKSSGMGTFFAWVAGGCGVAYVIKMALGNPAKK